MNCDLKQDCLFCKIIKNEIPSEVIFESDHIIIFKDISPQANIHFLAIPKIHFTNFNDFAKSDYFSAFFEELSIFTRESELLKGGFRLVNNNGVSAGQTVFHLHFHILSDNKLGGFGK